MTETKDRTDGADFGQKANPANPSNIMIGIMGPTGTGKSSLIRLLTGDESIKIGHSVESATSEIGHHNYFDKGGCCVTFVDSPGFDDSREGVTDTDVLRKIAAFLEQEFNQDKKLSGIIYLHRITDTRMGGVSLRNLRMFRKLCGDDALKNVVVVTTRWDDVQEKDRGAMEQREKELIETPGKFFQPLKAAGGHFLRHDNTAKSAHRIMEAMLKNEPIALQIQNEMRAGKKLEETAAGSELAAELKKLMDKHSSEMKNLKEEMAEAITAKDEALKKELEAERIKMQKEMTKWEEQKKALADGLAAVRADAIKRQDEADRRLREQAAEFARRPAVPAPQVSRSNPSGPAKLQTITSGKKHTICSIKHGRYVTCDNDDRSVTGRGETGLGRNWIFTKLSSGNWVIKSSRCDHYLSTNNDGDVRARSQREEWKINTINGEHGKFRLYNTAYGRDMVLALDNKSVGTPISLVDRKGNLDEIWQINQV